jgi:hypothetical protein
MSGNGDPDTPKDPEPKKGAGWRRIIFSWPSAAVAALAMVTAVWSNIDTIRPKVRSLFVPAEVHASLTRCRADKIVLELTNPGGRAATVEEPTFTIVSALGSTDLDMSEFVKVDPFAAYNGTVSPGHRDPLSYSSRDPETRSITPFFSDDERRGQCQIRVSVPVRGADPVTDTCPCGR